MLAITVNKLTANFLKLDDYHNTITYEVGRYMSNKVVGYMNGVVP